MNFSKLFRVLVVGGSMLGCSDDNESGRTDGMARNELDASQPSGKQADAAGTPDSANHEDASPASKPDASAGIIHCDFCNLPEAHGEGGCCIDHEDGSSTLLEGFECCWNTSCGD